MARWVIPGAAAIGMSAHVPQWASTLNSLHVEYECKLAAYLAASTSPTSSIAMKPGVSVTRTIAVSDSMLDDSVFPEHLPASAAVAACGTARLVKGRILASRGVASQCTIRVSKQTIQAAAGERLYADTDGDDDITIVGSLYLNRSFHEDDVVVEV